MDNMIHTLNKVTRRNQHKVPRKIATPLKTVDYKNIQLLIVEIEKIINEIGRAHV